MRAQKLALGLLALNLSLPMAAQADMFKPGIKDQIALGKRAAAQVRKEEKDLPDDDAKVREVRRLGAKLVALIPEAEKKKKPFEYTFDVIDSKELNAFALPGGPIFIYSGLLDKLKTEDEVVGILAHEITHIRNEHWASAYADNQKRKLGITVLLTVFNASDTMFNVAGISDTLIFELPYSRKHESEADKVGYDLAVKADYNPQGMVDVFRVLMKESKGGGKGNEWLSDHPALESRIQKIDERMKKESRSFPTMVPRKT